MNRRTSWLSLLMVGVLTTTVSIVATATSASAAVVAPHSVTAVAAPAGSFAADVTWQAADSDGALTGYTITAFPGGQTRQVDAQTTTLRFDGLQSQVEQSFTVTATDDRGDSAASAPSAPVRIGAPGGDYTALPPARILDTRNGTGGPAGAVRAGTPRLLTVTGTGGVPTKGVAAVVVNATVTGATAGGHLTLHPADVAAPVASNLNFTGSQTVANLATVPLDAQGRLALSIGGAAGTAAHVVLDVAGWISAPSLSPVGGRIVTLTPERILDTRIGVGAPRGPIGAAARIDVDTRGLARLPETGVTAVIANLTAVGPTRSGYLTAWPAGGARPNTSSVNFTVGQVVPNRLIVPVSQGAAPGRISIFNASGSTHALLDVVGYISADPATGGFVSPTSPTRVLDTRTALGGHRAKFAAGESFRLPLAGLAGLPKLDAAVPGTGVLLNVTATAPTVTGHVTVYPSASGDLPVASDLNLAAGRTVAGFVVARLGGDGAVQLFNNSGSTHLIVDVLGFVSGDTVLPATTEVLQSTAAVAQVTAASVTFNSLPADVAVGDVMVAGATEQTPDGLLRRVTSITRTADGRSVLGTAPASLTDAVAVGSFSFNGALRQATNNDPSADLPATTPRMESSSAAGRTGLRANLVGPPPWRVKLDLNKPFGHKPSSDAPESEHSGADSCQTCASVSAELTAGVELETGPSLDFGVNVEWPRFALPRMTMHSIGILDTKQVLALGAVGKAELARTGRLLSLHGATITLPGPGGVPIVVQPIIRVDAKLNGTLSAGMSMSVESKQHLELGVRYAEGDFRRVHKYKPEFQGEFKPSAGSAALSLAVAPGFGFRLYGTASAAMSLEPFATATVAPADDPWWKLDVGATASFQGDFTVLGRELGNVDFSGLTLFETTLLQAAGRMGADPADPKPESTNPVPTADPSPAPSTTAGVRVLIMEWQGFARQVVGYDPSKPEATRTVVVPDDPDAGLGDLLRVSPGGLVAFVRDWVGRSGDGVQDLYATRLTGTPVLVTRFIQGVDCLVEALPTKDGKFLFYIVGTPNELGGCEGSDAHRYAHRYDVQTGQAMQLSLPAAPIGLSSSFDGRTVAVMGEGPTTFWDVASGARLTPQVDDGAFGFLLDVASPPGTAVMLGFADQQCASGLAVIDLSGRTPMTCRPGEYREHLTSSPDGTRTAWLGLVEGQQHLLIGDHDGTVVRDLGPSSTAGTTWQSPLDWTGDDLVTATYNYDGENRIGFKRFELSTGRVFDVGELNWGYVNCSTGGC